MDFLLKSEPRHTDDSAPVVIGEQVFGTHLDTTHLSLGIFYSSDGAKKVLVSIEMSTDSPQELADPSQDTGVQVFAKQAAPRDSWRVPKNFRFHKQKWHFVSTFTTHPFVESSRPIRSVSVIQHPCQVSSLTSANLIDNQSVRFQKFRCFAFRSSVQVENDDLSVEMSTSGGHFRPLVAGE